MNTLHKIRLVALDLDGTLLADDGSIPRENIDVLQELARKGVIIVLSSGRMTDCVTPVGDLIGIDCPLVAYNGAMVRAKKRDKRKIIHHTPLASEYADLIIEYCFKNKFHLNYYLNDKLYAREDESLKKYALIYSNQTRAKFNFVQDLRKLKGNAPTKLILITDSTSDDRTRTRDYQHQQFSKVFYKKVKLFKTNPEYLEFLNKNADKGGAIRKLSEFYGIKRESIIAFGDGENDIEMLEFAGIGIALSNASQKLKKGADDITEFDNNHAGVAHYLKTNKNRTFLF